MKSKSLAVYNLIFPLYIFFLLPLVAKGDPDFLLVGTGILSIILLGNFFIDALVMTMLLRAYRVADRIEKKTMFILKVWFSGFIADFVGAGFIFMIGQLGINEANFFPVTAGCGAIISALVIYAINYWLLRRIGIDGRVTRRISLFMALITAPWLFFVSL